MHINRKHMLDLGLEDLADIPTPKETQPGYVEQPQIPLYLPEIDGVQETKQKLMQMGLPIDPRPWSVQPGMEASQAILHHLMKKEIDEEEKETEEKESYHDYSLFALAPDADPYLYKQLDGNKQGLVVLADSEEAYPPEMMEFLAEKVGMERIFCSVESLAYFLTQS